MKKEDIKRVIIEYQERVPELNVFDRDISFDKNANYIITGQRRAGKTFILYRQIQKLISEGRSKEEILFINFEDERLLEFNVRDFDLIIECYKELYDHDPILFFDEIQNISGWAKFARRMADAQYRIFITGSNATMFSREMASTLGGRFIVKEIDTLSFEEFLIFKDLILERNFAFSEQRFQLKKLFNEWFYQGGFPEVLKYQDKKEYLNTIFQKVFLGDIISRYQVRNKYALNLMIKKLAESTMDEVSFNRIKNIIQSTGIKVGTTTLIDYFSYLEESFLLRSVHNFRKKISERETKRKYYFRDHGLLGLFINDPESIILETIVYNHLIRKYPDNVYYIKDKYETDFYIQNEQLIQVCYNISSEETRKREINALVKANNQVKAVKGLIVTMDHEEKLVEADLEISIVPVWKWILDDKQT